MSLIEASQCVFAVFQDLKFDFACPHRGVCVTLALHKEPVALESSIEYDSLVVVEVRKHGVEI